MCETLVTANTLATTVVHTTHQVLVEYNRNWRRYLNWRSRVVTLQRVRTKTRKHEGHEHPDKEYTESLKLVMNTIFFSCSCW